MTRCALAVVLASLLLGTFAPAAGAQVRTVRIGGTSYLAGSVPSLVGRIVKTPAIRIVLAAIQACPNANAYAFVSTKGAGLTAWVPDRISGCFGTSGGGPLDSPCLQAFRTPRNQDPAGVSGRPSAPRSYVLIAATSTQTCADLSTQVPGGVWGRITTNVAGLRRGQVLLVKCQVQTRSALVDYLSPFSTSLPASKLTYVVDDRFFYTRGSRLAGVPGCSGVNF